MAYDKKVFRPAVVGGFSKDDVLDYIERLAAQQEDEVTRLTCDIADLRLEKVEIEKLAASFKEKVVGLESKNAELLERLSGLSIENGELLERLANKKGKIAQLEASFSQIEEDELHLSVALDSEKAENEALRQKIVELEALRDQFSCMRDKLPEIELCAYRRAKQIEEEAVENARRIQNQSAELMAVLKGRMLPLYNEYETFIQQAGQKFQAFRTESNWIGENMSGILEVLDKVMIKESSKSMDIELPRKESFTQPPVLQKREPNIYQPSKSED